jgi:hypothetical protein
MAAITRWRLGVHGGRHRDGDGWPLDGRSNLYMIITFADGSRHAMALHYPFASAACQSSEPHG